MVNGLMTDGLCFVWSIVICNKKVNPSTPWLEGKGLLRVDPERGLAPPNGSTKIREISEEVQKSLITGIRYRLQR